MIHLGDITEINGAAIEPVDVITGGSPCQDLSVAGKRQGLSGSRSGLFMEQIRIIKEMRCADVQRGRTGVLTRPRYMVWENVPGAFSSNKRADFGAVLQETLKVAYPKAPIISIPKNGWPTAGCLTISVLGRECSVAWRVLDAQFWGVPQRRRRIALVADFGGQSAPEILFVRKSVSGDIEESRTQGQAATKNTGTSVTCGNYIFDCRGNGGGLIAPTITGNHNNRVTDYSAVVLQSAGFLDGASKDAYSVGYAEEKSPTLRAGMIPSIITTVSSFDLRPIVRRLTPLECERLQGYPDNWTLIPDYIDSKGKLRKTSDTARYKALGNSIALPQWKWILKRISAQYERDATLGSLFDGIGGFPFCWEQINGRGSARWASEIDDFPIAVTKYHFGS